MPLNTKKQSKIVLMICSLKTYKGVNDFVDLAERMSHINFDLVLNATSESISDFFKEHAFLSKYF